MLIDWFTVGAQALNFIVLVWLMRRFLYRPVLKAIDAREKKIAAELAGAAAKEAEARKERDEFQHKNEEIDQQRAALLKKATAEATAERLRLLEEVRKEGDAVRDKQREAMRSDARRLNQAVSRRTQEEVFAVSRRALADLATTTLEECIAEVFIRRFGELDGAARAALADAVRSASEPAIVRSAFELPEAQRAAIQDTLNRALSADVRLRFEAAPDLVAGIELATNGHKVGWSIADYLGSLEEGVADLLRDGEKVAAGVASKARAPLAAAIESRPPAGPESESHEQCP